MASFVDIENKEKFIEEMAQTVRQHIHKESSMYDVYKLLYEAGYRKQAEVVRCKDCINYRCYGNTSLLVDGKNVKAGWCHRRARYDEEYRMLPDDFCSYGERNGK